MKNRNLLLATDLSANAVFAAQWAQSYAERAGVKVIAAHIIEISVPNWLRDAYNVLEDDEKRAKVEERVQEWYREHTGGELESVLVDAGNIDEKLGEMADENDTCMIVLARSGKSAITKFLAGSTAQMLTANPPCPVVVVHPDHAKLREDTKIVVATDLTETAEEALGVSASMAGLLGAPLDIVHASNLSSSPALDDTDLPESMTPEALEARARTQLESVIASHEQDLKDVTYTTHILEAAPVEGITSFVEEQGTDLLVLGNAAHYTVLTNVFGRVSVKLMQTLDATCVIVPPEGEAQGE